MCVYDRTYWSDTALGSLTYSDNAMNQYTAIGAVAPTHDSRGNTASTNYGGGLALTYDAENLLTAAGPVTYDYDLFGRRSRLTYYLVTEYVWDGAHTIAEYMNGSLTKYIYGPGLDRPVAMIRGAGASQSWYYYYTDAIGSVRLMTNAAGTPVESYTYDAYGQPRVMRVGGADGNWLTEDVSTWNYSIFGNSIMFTGRWWHNRTGLYYYRFRDYDPELGRFLQPDPAGYIDTMNLYAYCGNNPVNWIDPWGLTKKKDIGEMGGYIGAGGCLVGGLAIGAGATTFGVGTVVVGGVAAGYCGLLDAYGNHLDRQWEQDPDNPANWDYRDPMPPFNPDDFHPIGPSIPLPPYDPLNPFGGGGGGKGSWGEQGEPTNMPPLA